MAHLPYRHHGYFPQRRAILLPLVSRCRVQLSQESVPSETGSNPAATAEEQRLPSEHVTQTQTESGQHCNGDTRTSSTPSGNRQRQPGKEVEALLKRISIHPQAQRILGNSCIPVVSLERLNFQSLFLSSLQPVVSLVRLPCETEVKLRTDASCVDQQNGLIEHEENILEITQEPPQCRQAESSDLSQADSTPPTSWTEPYCPESPSSEEPEQDSGFDCESNPDQPYILFDSASDEWDPEGKTDSEAFYLDPDPDQTVVIQLDPEPEADQDLHLELEDEQETKCEVVKIETKCESVQMEAKSEVDIIEVDDSEDQSPDEEDSACSTQQPAPGAAAEEMESEDFCAVCLNGGDLLCCDRCPKVYHVTCHIPPLISFPQGDWVCTLCRSDQEPVETYDCENMSSRGGVKAPYTLSNQDQRRCEKLTLLLYCHTLSAPFHEPVSPLARNYYQIIKRPMNLSVIRRKLDKSNTLHYFTAEQFVDDVLLMFKNCATFNYPDSEVAQAGRNLEVFFLSKLKEIFPERTFPSASQDVTDRARLRWLGRKRKENYRRKRCMFSGKKYYL